jgi:hypothetical protein
VCGGDGPVSRDWVLRGEGVVYWDVADRSPDWSVRTMSKSGAGGKVGTRNLPGRVEGIVGDRERKVSSEGMCAAA